MGPAAGQCTELRRADLVQQRPAVERIEPEPRGDLLARRLRPFAEQIAEQITGLLAAPPVRTDLA